MQYQYHEKATDPPWKDNLGPENQHTHFLLQKHHFHLCQNRRKHTPHYLQNTQPTFSRTSILYELQSNLKKQYELDHHASSSSSELSHPSPLDALARPFLKPKKGNICTSYFLRQQMERQSSLL